MESPKRASTDHPVHDLIAERFSPYGFSDQPVSPEEIRSLFEAARWAASSYNEQPWNFIVATADDPEAFDRLASCLVDANQDWARRAPVLALGCIRTKFSRNGLPNLVALHDLGLASANLCLEATARRDHESHWRSLSSRAPGAKRRDSWGANQSEFERQPENPPRNGEKDLR
jgi:nitroreductase